MCALVCGCVCAHISIVLLVCLCSYMNIFWLVFVCGAEYSSKQFSLCFAGLMSALNFNDTSIKIGADVSQLTESQVEESEKSRVQLSARWLQKEVLSCVFICSSVIQETA